MPFFSPWCQIWWWTLHAKHLILASFDQNYSFNDTFNILQHFQTAIDQKDRVNGINPLFPLVHHYKLMYRTEIYFYASLALFLVYYLICVTWKQPSEWNNSIQFTFLTLTSHWNVGTSEKQTKKRLNFISRKKTVWAQNSFRNPRKLGVKKNKTIPFTPTLTSHHVVSTDRNQPKWPPRYLCFPLPLSSKWVWTPSLCLSHMAWSVVLKLHTPSQESRQMFLSEWRTIVWSKPKTCQFREH